MWHTLKTCIPYVSAGKSLLQTTKTMTKTKSLGNSEYLITGLTSIWVVAKRFDAWFALILPEGSEDTNDGEYVTCFETKKEAIDWLNTPAGSTFTF